MDSAGTASSPAASTATLTATNRCRITIYSARPGVVIGRKGAEIDKIKVDLNTPEPQKQTLSPANWGTEI
mgnify:CR=1 FL=1